MTSADARGHSGLVPPYPIVLNLASLVLVRLTLRMIGQTVVEEACFASPARNLDLEKTGAAAPLSGSQEAAREHQRFAPGRFTLSG